MAKEKAQTPSSSALSPQVLQVLGKHLSPQKERALLIFTMVTTASPLLLGALWWHRIPETVVTGLRNFRGEDDSLPRFVVAFGMAGLFCLLEAIAHMQLRRCQQAMVLPPGPIRFFGRWGVPVLSVLLSSALIHYGAGAEVLPRTFLVPCLIALALQLLGSHMLDCPREALIALRLSPCQRDQAWKALHRFAGLCWLSVGAALLCWTMVSPGTAPIAAAVAILSLLAPLLYGSLRKGDD